MSRHIYDLFAPGDRVEIVFPDQDKDAWQPAEVLRREPPGIWVRTADGREWFMTNTYRIRPTEKQETTDFTDLRKRSQNA